MDPKFQTRSLQYAEIHATFLFRHHTTACRGNCKQIYCMVNVKYCGAMSSPVDGWMLEPRWWSLLSPKFRLQIWDQCKKHPMAESGRQAHLYVEISAQSKHISRICPTKRGQRQRRFSEAPVDLGS